MRTGPITKAFTQICVDTYPDASPFWDSREGQEVLAFAQAHAVYATNSNRERCTINSFLMTATPAELNAHFACDYIAPGPQS